MQKCLLKVKKEFLFLFKKLIFDCVKLVRRQEIIFFTNDKISHLGLNINLAISNATLKVKIILTYNALVWLASIKS